MAVSLNRSLLARVLAVVFVLCGLVFLLDHPPTDGSVGSSSSSSTVAVQLDTPSPSSSQVGVHQEASLDKLWGSGNLSNVHSNNDNVWKDHNARTMRKLLSCLATETCTENQAKVVILEEDDYRKCFIDKTPGGEKIFARSVLATFDELGVTYLFTLGPGHLAFYYSMFPNLIRAVIMHSEHVRACWEDKGDDDCLKTSANPHGAPIHQLFSPDFFGWNGQTPFGREWTLVPEDYHLNDTYLGYSIQTDCMQKELPPYESKRRQVWVLAKHGRYFKHVSDTMFVKAAAALDIEFVSAIDHDDEFPIPPGVTNLGGPMPKPKFEEALLSTLAIVGLGDPTWSPTPWYGLCWKMPFLNPSVYNGDGTLQYSQHDAAWLVGDPYVYNYPHPSYNRDDDFIEALRKAIEPHERYIPPAMTQPEMNRRTLAWLDRDWKALAEERLAMDHYKELVRGKDFLL